MIGQRFGRLLIIDIEDWPLARGLQRLCTALCDCGVEKVVRLNSLQSSLTQSCGCLRQDRSHEVGVASATHGQCRNGKSLYKTWEGMIGRCTNPKHHAYKWYGARGITVCDEWKKSITQYAIDREMMIGPKPGPGYTVDRVDNDRGYFPGNIRWATRLEQTHNRRPLEQRDHRGPFRKVG